MSLRKKQAAADLELDMQNLQKLGHEMIPESLHALKAKVDELLAHAQPAKIEGGTELTTAAHSGKPLMRLEYELAVRRIGDGVDAMRKAGKAETEIAQWASTERRSLGVRFKNKTDPALREVIYKRNIRTYGDPLGPTYEDMKRGYRVLPDGSQKSISRKGEKTDTQIIESATHAGGDDLPWNLILDYGRLKKSGATAQAQEMLLEINLKVNGPWPPTSPM